jgi:DNA-binding IclR family transcriptional regulator
MSGHYQLGLAVIAMSGSVLGRIEILRVAGPQLRRLADETNETVSLWMRYGDNILSIEQIPGPNVLRAVDWLGQLSPLHRGSAAKAILASLSDRQVERYIRTQQQADSGFDRQALLEQLANVRSQGYAVNREEIMPHEFAVGAPILNVSSEPIAAVSVAVYRQEIHDSFLSSLAFSVMRTADTISRQCGYGVQARKLA